MTRVDFYLDADNKLAVAARIVQKGIAAGKRFAVLVADDAAETAVDREFWTFSAQAFVAHARADSTLADESPVVILQEIPPRATSDFDILLNLAEGLPEVIEEFERIIEIVTRDESEKAAARERFKAYRNRGCELISHRLGESE